MKFKDLKLKQVLQEQIQKQGFTEATAIQEKTIPEIQKGHDVVGQSETGSGKTIAFSLPLLEKIQPGKGIQALVLTPTRELCVQVKDSFEIFGKSMKIYTTAVYGGVGIQPQFNDLKRADIVIATPGRLLDHINRNSFNSRNLKFLVLDEVDKMFEMGFIHDVEEILRGLPKERQTLLFSATVPQSVNSLIKKYLNSPVFIKTKSLVDKTQLNQVYYQVNEFEKFSLLLHLLKQKGSGLSLVFCGTRYKVDSLSYNLQKQGIQAMAIHGGLSQNRRTHALDSLKKEHIQVLVATDVAARGLDIQNITHVYNYEVPKTSDDYVHRIGRTARAGKNGIAVTLLSDKDHDNFRKVMSDRSLEIKENDLPEFQKVPYIKSQRNNRRENSSRARPFSQNSANRRHSFKKNNQRRWNV